MIEKKVLIGFLSSIFSAICSFFTIFAITHKFGVELFGVYGYAFGLVNLFFFLSNLGFDEVHMKMVPASEKIEDNLGSYFIIKLVLTLFMFLSLFSFFTIFRTTLFDNINSNAYDIAIVLLVSNVLTGLSNFFLLSFVALGNVVKQQILLLLTQIASMVFIVIGILFNISLPWVLTGYIFGNLVTFIVSARWLLKEHPVKTWRYDKFKHYFKIIGPFLAINVLNMIQLNLDKTILQYFFNSYEVGLYFGVQRIYPLMLLMSNSLILIFLPLSSKMNSEGRLDEFMQSLYEFERILSLYLIPFLLFFIIFSPNIIITILGEDFQPAAPILIIYCLYAFLISISRPRGSSIIGLGYIRITVYCSIYEIIMNIVLYFVLIPILGGIGAILAIFLTSVGPEIHARIYFHKKIKYKNNKHIIIQILTGILTGIVSFFFLNSINYNFSLGFFDQLILTFIGILFYLSFYFLVLVLTREFKKKDLIFVMNLINPKKMKDFLLNELKS